MACLLAVARPLLPSFPQWHTARFSSLATEALSSPLSVQVTQGGLPVADAEVAFQISTGSGLLSDGTLRAGNAAATSGSSVTVTSNSSGLASAFYLAGPVAGDAGVTATLTGVVGQTTTFALSLFEQKLSAKAQKDFHENHSISSDSPVFRGIHIVKLW